METLTLPRLVGSRAAAATMVAGLDGDLAGESVAVSGRELLSGSAAFADELVRQVLIERKAHELVLVGVPEDFAGFVRTAAHAHGVGDRLVVAPAGSLRGL